MSSYKVREYLTPEQKNPYRRWLETLDPVTKERIQARIFRFELGNLGDYKHVGLGVYEARFDFGSGYRIYFGKDGRFLIILLMGGDKGSQRKDIKQAQEYWNHYRRKKGT